MARYSLNGDRRKSRFGFLRILLEIPIIVLSIYIAFVVDEYGKRKNDREIEKKYLQELLVEAKFNRDELMADQDARRRQVDYLNKLLAASNRAVDPDTLRDAINELMMIRLFSPTEAVYEDLVSSGNLRLIQSDSLRRTILEFRQRLTRVPLTEQQDLQLIQNQIEPYLINRQVISLLEAYGESEHVAISEQQADRIIHSLLNDRAFTDLVYLRLNRVRDVIYFENPMQWRLREMVSLLEGELKRFDN